MNFGKNKPKWYQFSHCQTSDKCEIVGQHKVKWVHKNNT
ncbi:hypothetical protein IMCC1989_2825 [gamma proteobacterium IMCC1989]|nr:hypothetical protein IMCC1989_2825 [gamma proteobacterium IMCC1989]